MCVLTDEGRTWLHLIEIKRVQREDVENLMIILKQFDLRKKVGQKTKGNDAYLIPWLIYHYNDLDI
jgi:hypothetical protein